MKYWVGITDNSWYRFLAERSPDEVNFWQPSGKPPFKTLPQGTPFLFKLHSPLNYIAGGGYYLSQSALPLSFAWDAFGEKNGTPTFQAFRERILSYRSHRGKTELDPTIGCLVLVEPFFFDEQDWIPVDVRDYHAVVQGRTMDTQTDAGRRLWDQVQERLARSRQDLPAVLAGTRKIAEEPAANQYGQPFLTRARLGQGSFRLLVTDAYERRCAMTGEKTLPVLQAAHIKPYAQSGPHSTSNGLLLRSDLHILFDRGYLTVNPDLQVEVSRSIKEQFSNGREYYALHGKPLSVLPASSADRPSATFLEWHNNQVYKG
jgi:putative restriction endonuclease